MFQILYGLIGLGGLAGCTSTFCIGTLTYLQVNLEQLTSGMSGLVEVFPWGWIVQFCNETFQTSDGTYNVWPSFNISFTYFYGFLICIVLARDARRLGITTWLAACLAVGTFFCFSMTIPIFLIKRAQKLSEVNNLEDTELMDYGIAGRALLVLQCVSTALLAVLCYVGAGGGNSLVYGPAFAMVGIVLPLIYAFVVFKGGDEPGQPMSKSTMINYLAVCAVVSIVFYGVTIHAGRLPTTYSVNTMATWFTDVFLFDSWVLRVCGVVIILESGANPMLAVVELLFAPFGFLAFAHGRFQAVKGRETSEYLAME